MVPFQPSSPLEINTGQCGFAFSTIEFSDNPGGHDARHNFRSGASLFQEDAEALLPKGFTYDYGGRSRQFIQEGTALIFAFFLAVIVIFLSACLLNMKVFVTRSLF